MGWGFILLGAVFIVTFAVVLIGYLGCFEEGE